MTSQDNLRQSNWSFLIYSILTLYYFGVVVFTYFVDYPTFGNVHEHFQDFINLTIRIREFGFIPPAIFMLLSTFSLLRFNHMDFPRWAILGCNHHLGQKYLLLDIQEFSLVSIFKNIIQYANKHS